LTPDVDIYLVNAPHSRLLIKLSSLQANGLIADAKLFDANTNPLDAKTYVNGNGELLLGYSGIEPDQDYFVAVSADRTGVFDTGSYQLDLIFASPRIRTGLFGQGKLTSVNRVGVHSLYVARSQMFHMALSSRLLSSADKTHENATLWMTIIDETGVVVHRVATRPEETRSSQSVVLRPGSYAVRVNVTFPTESGVRPAASTFSYRIDGRGISDPTGPEIIDASNDPFAPCDKLSNDFCYPNGHRSSDPFIFVDMEEVTPTNPPPDPGWMDVNQWYWVDDWLG
jgi:hypothetical protein